MRTIPLTLAAALALAAAMGCGDECSGFRTSKGTLAQAAPRGQVMTTTTSCSTCAHAHAQVLWQAPTGGVTGKVDLQVFPSCFVQPFVDSRTATGGVGDFTTDFNVKNCGDNIDYTAIATNNSNVTFTTLEVDVDCTPFKPKM